MTPDVAAYLNTFLLASLNIMAGMILSQFNELKKSTKETRDKLDAHVEDFSLHGFSRPSPTPGQ